MDSRPDLVEADRAKSGHLQLNSLKPIICVAAAERKYWKEELIAVNVLSAVRLNV